MQLAHIPLDRLNISALNMRHGKRAPDLSDILPSVRARGVLVPFWCGPTAPRKLRDRRRTATLFRREIARRRAR
ncbi:hypothetical protein MES5069_190146 [Mesorhizobium escarrei]|uniref:Uncharacterized protein n=1 Tax=Mesorhizobium escarrei TaxID=666018 RepID=A0ABM9DNG9_9HYPH|nr:hypothetical protein MES5069_190146 [Mesorhizobium escarrei]